MEKMKAAVRRSYGFPKIIQLEEIEKPVPGEGEVLIKVHATSVNRTDCANLTGTTFHHAFCAGLSEAQKNHSWDRLCWRNCSAWKRHPRLSAE